MRDATRLLRPVLLLLVALNLTVVCQGHHEGTRFAGAHLLLLGEPGNVPQATLDAPGAQAVTNASITQHTRLSAIGPSSNGTASASDSFVLGASVLLAAWATIGLSAIVRALASIFKSQTSNAPNAPPPRFTFSPISS